MKFKAYKNPDLDAADVLLEWIMEQSRNVYTDLSPGERLKICREIADVMHAERKRGAQSAPGEEER